MQPHLKARITEGTAESEALKNVGPIDLITFENATEMTTFINCFNESLRM